MDLQLGLSLGTYGLDPVAPAVPLINYWDSSNETSYEVDGTSQTVAMNFGSDIDAVVNAGHCYWLDGVAQYGLVKYDGTQEAIVYWSYALKSWTYVLKANFVNHNDGAHDYHKITESFGFPFGVTSVPTIADMDYLNANPNSSIEYKLFGVSHPFSFAASAMAPAYFGFPNGTSTMYDVDSGGFNTTIYAWTANCDINLLNIPYGPVKSSFTLDASNIPTSVDYSVFTFNGDGRTVDSDIVPDESNDFIIELGWYHVSGLVTPEFHGAAGSGRTNGVTIGSRTDAKVAIVVRPTYLVTGVVSDGPVLVQVIYIGGDLELRCSNEENKIENSIALSQMSETWVFGKAYNGTGVATQDVNHFKMITDASLIAEYDAGTALSEWQTKVGI